MHGTQSTRPGGALVTRCEGGVRYRGAAAADCAAVGSFIGGLSPRTMFLRFFTPASPPSSAVLRAMCGAGSATDVLVGTHDGVIVAHAMAVDSVSPGGFLVADIGLVVADEWQDRGVGSEILGRLVARAAGRGVSVLVMDVLPENRRMLAMISRRWADAAYQYGADSVTVRVYLPAATARGTSGGAAFRAA